VAGVVGFGSAPGGSRVPIIMLIVLDLDGLSISMAGVLEAPEAIVRNASS
jgi:hypothetical protein